jgi:hypothetical protein
MKPGRLVFKLLSHSYIILLVNEYNVPLYTSKTTARDMKHVSYAGVLINNLLLDENLIDRELNTGTMLEITRNVCLETCLNKIQKFDRFQFLIAELLKEQISWDVWTGIQLPTYQRIVSLLLLGW